MLLVRIVTCSEMCRRCLVDATALSINPSYLLTALSSYRSIFTWEMTSIRHVPNYARVDRGEDRGPRIMHLGWFIYHIHIYSPSYRSFHYIRLENDHGRKYIYTWTNAGWASCWGCRVHVSHLHVDQVYLSTSMVWSRDMVPDADTS